MKSATVIILQAMATLKPNRASHMLMDLYERLFAIYLKTRSLNLALAFLNYLEVVKSGELTFLGQKVQMSELTMAVDEWTRGIAMQGYVEFQAAHAQIQEKYLANIPLGITTGMYMTLDCCSNVIYNFSCVYMSIHVHTYGYAYRRTREW